MDVLAKLGPTLIFPLNLKSISDWVVLHDQPLSRGYRHAVLGDKETRNGANATGTGPVHLLLHPGVEHQQLGAHQLLCRDRKIHRSSVETPQTATG